MHYLLYIFLAATRELQSGSTILPSRKDLDKQIVSTFLTTSIPPAIADSTPAAQNSGYSNDSAFTYTVNVLNLCFILHAFRDAVKERDGDGKIRYWKLLAIIFDK